MPAFQQKIDVQMEGGETFTVTADQRDLAKYEQQEFYDPARQFTMVRFMAWNAGRRAGLHKLTWDKFEDQCVEAGDPEDENTPLDPTQPGAPGSSSKTSQP